MDLHLTLRRDRTLFPYPIDCLSPSVLCVDFSTVYTVDYPHPGKICPFSVEIWANFLCLHLLIYCQRFVRLWYDFCIYGARVFDLALYIWVFLGSVLTDKFSLSFSVSWLLLMSLPSPTSPLSFSSNTDGSVDNQNDVSSPSHPSQSRVSALLDGGRSDYIGQPSNSKPPSFSSVLKLRVGSNCSAEMPLTEPKFHPQLRENQSPGSLPVDLPAGG